MMGRRKNAKGKIRKNNLKLIFTPLFCRTHTLIAVGGTPKMPDDVPGAEYGTDSDGFFTFEDLPKLIKLII